MINMIMSRITFIEKGNVMFGLKIFILACSFILSTFAYPIELDELVQNALDVNPELKKSKAEFQAIRTRVAQEGVWEDPMIGLETMGIPASGVDFGDYQELEWSFSQKIPFPGKNSLKAKIALMEAHQSYWEYQSIKNRIIKEIKTAYIELILLEKQIQVYDQTIVLLDQTMQISQKKYEVGQASQSEVFQMQIELAHAKNEIILLKNKKNTYTAKINLMLNRSIQTPVMISIWSDFYPELTYQELVQQASKYNPELKKAALELFKQKLILKSAQKEYWPDFEARFETRHLNGNSGLEEYDVMLQINIPWLWTRNRIQASIQQNQFEIQSAVSAYQLQKNMILKDLQEALIMIENSKTEINHYESYLLPTLVQNIAILQEAYQTNKNDLLNILDQQRKLLEYRLAYEKSLSEYHKNLAEIESQIGNTMISDHKETIFHEK